MLALLTPDFWFGFFSALGVVATLSVATVIFGIWWIISREPDPGDDT